MRFIGLDVHRDFCEVAISEGGRARSAGQVAARPAELALFAQSLGSDDRVVLEVTGNALAIARSKGRSEAVVHFSLPRNWRTFQRPLTLPAR